MSEERLEMSTRRANEEGSIGIGAMIVFIALILVAAVASTIIIKTAEELQQNAEQTSADTRQQISGKVALVDVIVRSTGDELGTGATHVASMDVVWRVSSGSTGMYPADVTYYITCQVSNAVGAFYDQGALSANLISTGAAVAASTELDAGNTYYTTITLANADSDGGNTLTTADTGNGCDALFVQGAEIDMRISVDGGGDTATELKVNSITAGSSIM
jgi:flagellin FlaB